MNVRIYADALGNKPFDEWLVALRDVKAQATIRARLERVRAGNFGDCKPVRDGVQELRIDLGPGVQGVPEPTRHGAGVAAVWKRQERPRPRH